MGFEFFGAKKWSKGSDAINKGYNDGERVVECKAKNLVPSTPANSNVELNSKFSNNGDACSTEYTLKLACNRDLFSVSNTVDSSNKFKNEVKVNLDDYAPGLQFSVKSNNSAKGGDGKCPFTSSRIGLEYAQDTFMAEVGVDPLQKNAIDVTVAGGCDGMAAGVQATYSAGESKLASYNFSVGYAGSNFQVVMNACNNASKEGSSFYGFNCLCGTVYHEMVPNELKFAGQFKNDIAAGKTSCSIGAVYQADNNTTLRSKVDNCGTMHMAADFKTSDFATLNITTRANAKTMDGAAFGWGITFEK